MSSQNLKIWGGKLGIVTNLYQYQIYSFTNVGMYQYFLIIISPYFREIQTLSKICRIRLSRALQIPSKNTINITKGLD